MGFHWLCGPALAVLAILSGLACGGAGGPAATPGPSGVRAADPAGTRLTLLQTTDLHGHARGSGHLDAGPPDAGGYARIAAFVESVRAGAGHPVLLVDSGDWSMGTLYDLTLARQPFPLLFADALRYDCLTLGNHEFDHTPAGLAGILAAARSGFGFRTPIVASNLDLGGDTHLAPWVGPGRAIQPLRVQALANGVRVGYLGLMGRDAAGDAASAPVRFTDYARDYPVVQGLVDELRNRRGCHLVVALSHAGTRGDGEAGEDVDLARHVTGIDVIASGHTHNPLAGARPVANGAWRTLVGCAGAFGAGVLRLDLVLRPGGGVDLEGAENRPMTAASLAGLGLPADGDPAFGVMVAGADRTLNRALEELFVQLGWGGDAGGDPLRGLYRPVAASAVDLGGQGHPPGPSGLGNLCADALRAVPNALLAAGLEPAGDRTPFTAAALAAGELRGGLEAGRPVTFADVFGLLPLGLSPDPGQRQTTGEPLVSGYLEPDGTRVLCALQLLAQTGLVNGDLYLNLSGLAYALDPDGAREFFAAASAAAALDATRGRAGDGSIPAARALAAVAGLPGDRGAALIAAAAAGNPYAQALIRLAGPASVGAQDPARSAANLEVLGQVAAAAREDAARGGTRLTALLMARALAAVGPVAAFAPDDPACTGPAAPLGPGRIRVALDLFLVLMVDQAQALLGTRAALYRAAQGDAVLTPATPAGLRAILANRIPLATAGPFRELKAWLAVLLHLTTPPGRGGHFQDGRITAEYAAPADLRRFPEAGPAVRVRNAAYPLARVAALADLAAALRQAP